MCPPELTAAVPPPADVDVAEGAVADLTYGVLALGGADVALPLSALREVVPRPETLDALPVQAPGLLGAMTVRDLVVPVVDLRLNGTAGERDDKEVVVLVTQDERVIGVVADGTRDILRVPAADLRPMQTDGPLLCSATFRHPVWGRVVSVLDVPALLQLPGVPTAQDAAHARAVAVASAAGAGSRRRLTVVRCDSTVLALDVEHVHTTLADASASASPLAGDLCLGTTAYRGRDVPVVDPLALLGLGRIDRDARPSGLVLELGEGYVVLALSELVDIVDVPADIVLPLPGFAVRRPDLVTGLADVEEAGECLVLDGGRLHDDAQLLGFAALNTPTHDAAASATDTLAGGAVGGAVGRRPIHLTYSIGHDVATPLEQIEEIIAFRGVHTATAVGDAVLGVVVHRQLAVPAVCLATLLGLPRPPLTDEACLLLVALGDGEHVGLAVAGLRALEPLVWEADAVRRRGKRPASLAGSLDRAPLVSVGDPARLLPELDLRAIAGQAREAISGLSAAAPAPLPTALAA